MLVLATMASIVAVVVVFLENLDSKLFQTVFLSNLETGWVWLYWSMFFGSFVLVLPVFGDLVLSPWCSIMADCVIIIKMSFLNNEDEEMGLELSKARSNPSRIGDRQMSKENSLDLQRWHSFKEDILRDTKIHSYSYNRPRISHEHSEPRLNSMTMADKSNSELKSSVASKYIEYLDHYKKTYGDILKKNDGEEVGKERESVRMKIGQKDSNILLNSTILSSCFNDRSFYEVIQEHSNEADFIEEGDSGSGNSSFFGGNPREGFSKVFNNLERESFSFDNNRALSGLFEEIPKDETKKNCQGETSFDTLDHLQTLNLEYFFQRDKSKDHLGTKPSVSNYDRSGQYIKIVVIHLSLGDNKFSDEYILTSNGLLNSRKNTRPKALVIGRMSQVIEDVRPNDIVLPFSDKSISRVHCAIEYKHKFSDRKIPTCFVAFLSGKKARIAGARCSVKRLTIDLLHRIYSFIKPPSKVYALDLGSSTGTYKRVLYSKQYRLRRGDIYMVGNSFQFSVNYVCNRLAGTASLDQLYQLLADEAEEKTEIHGLTTEQMRKVDLLREKKRSVIKEILKEGDNDSFLRDADTCIEAYFPLLVLEIENPPSTMKPIHILLSLQDEQEFTIGRLPDNDISLNSRDISKYHMRIQYGDNRWLLLDGTKRKNSINGTWYSLNNKRNRFEKGFSDPVEIEDGDQLKISENLISFNFNNF